MPAGARTLTVRQLRDLIDEVYASKAKHDRKCADARQPTETLAQHLATYLQTRYGLSRLVHEYAAAVYDGIRCFEAQDADVRTPLPPRCRLARCRLARCRLAHTRGSTRVLAGRHVRVRASA